MHFSKSLFSIILIFSTQLYAETILFRDGTKVQGKIKTQDKNTITINTPEGVKIVSKGEITKVIYKDRISDTEELKIRREEEKKQLALEEKANELERIKKEKLPTESVDKKQIELAKPNPNQMYKDRTALGAFWRSLLVPGWGQFYQGREWAGVIYPTVILGGGVAIYQKNRIYQNAVKDYNDIQNPYSDSALLLTALNVPNPLNNPSMVVNYSGSSSDLLLNLYNTQESTLAKQKKAVENHYTELRAISYAVAALWLWNAIDAFIFHPNYASLSDGISDVPQVGDLRFKIDSSSARSPGYANTNSTEHRVYLETYF